MNDVRGTIWAEHGSSIVWDPIAIDTVATSGATVSLREALAWIRGKPTEPPGDASVVVVTGLQTALEAIDSDDVATVLHAVGALIRWQENAWPEAALVFAARGRESFGDPLPSGDVSLRLVTGGTVAIADALWGGAKRDACRILATRIDAQGRETDLPIGYWLRRGA